MTTPVICLYRNYEITREIEPCAIQVRGEWSFAHKNLCPPEDFRFGTERTPAAVLDAIDALEDR